MSRDGGREVVLGGGRCGTSGDDLLRLLSVGAPAVGGRHRNIIGGSGHTHSASRPCCRTYPGGENGGSTHSESTPRPKSDLKNKRLTPTILMTLRSLDKSKLNARLQGRGGSPCFRRLLSEVQWHV